MAIKVIVEFPDKATVRVIAYVKDDDDALVEPTSVKVTIYDPSDEKQVDGVEIVVDGRVEDGIYEYYYHKGSGEDPMDEGQWYGEILVADGTGADTIYSPRSFGFAVK